MSSSMKEEKMEVITSFASGKPLEQSQSRFKSLEMFLVCEFLGMLTICYLTPHIKSRRLVRMCRQYQKPQ